MLRFQTDDCLTPEEEAEIDARYLEEQEHEWLVSWAEDFHSDGWLSALSKALEPAGDA
jgi:hypothetical protein